MMVLVKYVLIRLQIAQLVTSMMDQTPNVFSTLLIVNKITLMMDQEVLALMFKQTVLQIFHMTVLRVNAFFITTVHKDLKVMVMVFVLLHAPVDTKMMEQEHVVSY